MGAEDVKRQALNVFRMKLLGATVVPVESGSQTLKDALNEAMRDWVTNVETRSTSSARWRARIPYPMMVRDFQSRDRQRVRRADAGGRRTPARRRDRLRRRRLQRDGHLPSVHRRRAGEADRRRGGGRGHRDRAARGVAVARARPACCTATAPTCCRTTTARSSRRTRSRPASTIPGVGPEHAWLKDSGPRASTSAITDDEALAAFHDLLPRRGHHPGARIGARARARRRSSRRRCPTDRILLVNLSGRGDKDMHTVAERSGLKFYCRPECDPARR